MTEEDKNLLLKDLCARLPYGVKCKDWTYGVNDEHIDVIEILDIIEPRYESYQYKGIDARHNISRIRPYLRPMSSMTEEELKELNEKYGNIAYFFIQEPPYYHGLQAQHSDIGSIEISEFSEIYDWLNAHHFDYRGLIPMGLALEAPADMYK